MSELEDQLLGSDDEEEAPKPKRENSTIRQMREALEARETELKATQERASRYEEVFLTQSGLTDKQSKALRAAGYEVSPEGIESFRSDVLGVTPPAAEEPPVAQEEAEEEAPEANFQPTPVGGVAPSGKREISSEDLLDLFRTDPIKADKLLREGRVSRKPFNPGGPAF